MKQKQQSSFSPHNEERGQNNQDLQVMSIKEAAEFLGYSVKTLYKKNSLNEIPFHNPTGKKVLYFKHELIRWIKNGQQLENAFTVQYFGKAI